MNTKRLARALANYRKNVLTASEFADFLLYELAFEKELDTAFLATGELPTEVWRDFDWHLRRVRDAGFHWTPFLIGGKSPPADPERLRQILAAFEPRARALRDQMGADAPPRSWGELLRRYAAGERSFAYAELDTPPFGDLRDAVLDGADLSRAFLVADFRRARLRGVNFERSNLKTCDFRDADLDGADLSWCALDATQFAGASLRGTNFRGATNQGLKLGRDARPDW